MPEYFLEVEQVTHSRGIYGTELLKFGFLLENNMQLILHINYVMQHN